MLYFNLMIELYEKLKMKELEKIPFPNLNGNETDEHINYYKNNKNKLGNSYKKYMNLIFRYSRRCFTCYSKNEKNKKCSGCNLVYYCSKECQIQEWLEHKKICS